MLAVSLYLFITLALLTLLGLYVFYDRRSERFARSGTREAAHHCIRCDTLYTAERDENLHACPKCGYANPRLKY